MKRFVFLLVALATLATVVTTSAPVSGHTDKAAAPIYGVTIPPGYRDWKMIAGAQLKTDKVDQLRAQLGNEIAVRAYQEGARPFPDGAIIVALHWNRVSSEDNNRVLAGPFPGARSFVVGSRVNMQVMVKDCPTFRSFRKVGDTNLKPCEHLRLVVRGNVGTKGPHRGQVGVLASHSSKTTMGGAASVVVVSASLERWASPP
jgi:hypothetical protein